jgi:hypothetical protein
VGVGGHERDGHGGRPRHRPAGLVRFERLRQLLDGEIAGEPRAIARDDERASRDEWRVLNGPRADRLETFPAALAIAGDDLGAPTFLRLVERWRTANALVTASKGELVASPGRPGTAGRKRFADRITQALAPRAPGRDELPL